MLVLTRKPREEIRIGNGVTITILRVKGQQVRVGIEAPNDVRIVRGELDDQPETDSVDATESANSANASVAETEKNRIVKRTVDLTPPSAEPAAPLASTDFSGTARLGETTDSAVSSCRVPKPRGGKSVLKILAERQRAKLSVQRSQLGIQSPQ